MSGYHAATYHYNYDGTEGLGVKHIVWDCPKGYSSKKIMPTFRLAFCISGVMHYKFQHEEFDVFPGDVVFADVGEPFEFCAAPGTSYERIILKFTREWFQKNAGDEKLLEPFINRIHGGNNHFSVSGTSGKFLRECFYQLVHPSSDTTLQYRCCILPILWHIRELYFAKPLSEPVELTDPIMYIRYIDEAIPNNINVNMLTEKLGISRSTLYRLIKEKTGYPVGTYLRIKRAEMARNLLKTGISAAEACSRCGFKDYSTFYRNYKQVFGVSPQEEVIK